MERLQKGDLGMVENRTLHLSLEGSLTNNQGEELYEKGGEKHK